MNIRHLAALALLIPGPALAADRIVTVTSYDRIRVDGPYRVEILTGRGASAKMSGDRAAIDQVDISVQGMTLVIRPDRTGWKGGWPGETKGGPVLIRLTTGELRGASVSGSGSMMIDKLRGLRMSLVADGSARMSVGSVQTDRLDIAVTGSGLLTLAGETKALAAIARGSGAIEGAGLTANDLNITSESASDVSLAAKLTAKVVSSGSGRVVIGGKPACTVNALGSGPVMCGAEPR